MKFVRNKNIKNVNSYNVSFNKLQYISDDNLYLDNNLITKNTDCLAVILNEFFLIYSNYIDYKTYVLNIKTNKVKNIGPISIQNLVYNSWHIGYQYDDEFNSVIVFLNDSFEIVKSSDLKNVVINFVSGEIGIQNYSREKLIAYSFHFNKILWQKDVFQLNEACKEQNGSTIVVYSILGIFEKDLLVVLDDSSILRIDIETGDLKEHFKITLFADTENEVIAQYNFIQFQGDKLIYYRYGQYAEYDLVRNKITYDFDIREELTTQKLHDNIDSYIKEGDVLYYYISGFGSFSLPSIVMLNIRTKEVIWKYIWDNPDVFYKDFQKSETALYLLDSDNTLHIFEKE